ncbi:MULTISPECIES: hypothetical protein [Chryseobacterium]|uniref:Uncharacterized protein n=1 Tax=Chryseobacterium camelliae TaxID=1265445 RepID=A0ABU0TP24_9FLAO|nr:MULTISPECIES: hypothetical protein [Chryseobacterium]MDT3407581.1 hypothetical protein [Pseudacidovorax intermedius]MDQ1098566.1 hypothetical protein [Chryseobacterium camelliae]MDQ1102490.1 hypothetical protein [Chryseobacterium sp. SORGH_AS_1048]MDR6085924.1 hypothetical protein [Chryseobacterium sp. SORGH_AS_0909]MDR6130290.1 hypothetical protein [Chryseobacterium sp. SORGH_AS_1175]
MKFFCSIFLIFYMVFRPLIPLAEYAVNYRYIAEVLCINKAKPELHCNGKCYLSKELAKNSDAPSPLDKVKNSGQKILDIYLLPGITAIQHVAGFSSEYISFAYRKAYAFLFLYSIFRPPVF